MKRINFIFIILSLNCLSGYLLDCPLTIFLLRPLIEGVDWDPISRYVFLAIPLAIALPILLGDIVYRLCVRVERKLQGKSGRKIRNRLSKCLDWFVTLCFVIMLIWAAIPPDVKSSAFDKRSYIFDQMYRRYRGLPIYETDDLGEFRQINNFSGTILQNAGADGLWNTKDDIIRLEESAR